MSDEPFVSHGSAIPSANRPDPRPSRVCADCGQEIWADDRRINSWYSMPTPKTREMVCRYEISLDWDGEIDKLTAADYHNVDLDMQRHWRLINGKGVVTVGPLEA